MSAEATETPGIQDLADRGRTQNERVCAVIVTYNRKELLRECLCSHLRQSRRADQILVVNNASVDGTREMLTQDFPNLPVLNLPDNIGGAGGFCEGMKWAYREGFDWMWLMDDDVEPVEDALDVMLRYHPISDFIHLRKTEPDGPFHWEGMWDLSMMTKLSFPEDVSFRRGRAWIPVNYGCFEGALVNRKVVDWIGFPDARFFLDGDDLIYGYLASLHTNVIYVNHVGFRRKLPQVQPPNYRKYYFTFRNRFLIYEYIANTGLPVSRVSFWFRMLQSVLWHSRQLARHKGAPKLKSVCAILRGVRDGMHGRYGRPSWF